ncbi:hypothetical protein LSH36_11g11008 [Paralvinella palmiformis]|uniref:Uncharacterized protein n=1 Tax=Paralvinella palmiformis TaxID=53620 RepID=A0AAD9KDS7_9ANNE|nr:hypothetical protein LSH36_11g11008 [Paralvinella palmiformis]
MTIINLLIASFLFQEAISHDPVCGDVPSNFLDYDVGENHLTVGHTQFKYLQGLGTYDAPYVMFGLHDNRTRVEWRDFEGHIVLTSASSSDIKDGLLLNPVNLDTISLWYRVGSIFCRYTTESDELYKISSNICDFTAEAALIITYDCFRSEIYPNSPKARFQTIVAYGKDNENNEKTYLLMIYDILPGDAWFLPWEQYQHYITFLRDKDRYPIGADPNTVLAIDVTSRLSLIKGKQLPNGSSPCQEMVSAMLAIKGDLLNIPYLRWEERNEAEHDDILSFAIWRWR